MSAPWEDSPPASIDSTNDQIAPPSAEQDGESVENDTTTPVEMVSDTIAADRLNHNPEPPQTDDNLLPVVGLGGSAGSIGALQEFFGRIPTNLGIAYVVVVHLSPDHESQLHQILQSRTRMPVIQVQGAVKVEADHVYVIPPAYHLTMSDGEIHLTSIEQEDGKRVAVDLFFRTLATSRRSKAASIVLSGIDGDGAIGIKRIKEHGGITIAQDPAEAKYDGMPRSAIDTGMVDWILGIEPMVEKLIEWVRNEKLIHLPASEDHKDVESDMGSQEDVDEAALRGIFAFLHTRTGHDFSHYKRGTVLRRIGRRLQVNSLTNLSDYVNFLRTHPGETGALLQDLLISVTNFFRDPEAFHALEDFIPRLFRNRKPSDTVRVWVPGCATGEEAYSLAMILEEYAGTLEDAPEIQIFATDLDEQALRFAREGTYPATIVADVSPERLRRFFVFDQNVYRVKREMRERVLFAPHNVLKDAPFSRLDLISCRNLLIYFTKEAQEQVFGVFNFALKPAGILFLGGSESADDNPLFFVQNKKHRIYERQMVSRVPSIMPVMGLPVLPPKRLLNPVNQAYVAPIAPEVPRLEAETSLSYSELHLKLLEEMVPPSVLVNFNYEIVHLSEHVGRFLRFAGGEMSVNLLAVVNPSLRVELRAALFRAVQNKENVNVPSIPVEIGGQKSHISLKVRPLRDSSKPGEASSFVLVVFDEQTETEDAIVVASTAANQSELLQSLESELQHLRNYLRASVEQYEASTEELKASNEELQAMNEEQRSAAEELETSREEIQAANEELTTVNVELKSKVDEVSRANSDLQNLMASTTIATIFLSRDLRIKRYTPPAVEIFNLIPTDTGRPLADLRPRFGGENFVSYAEQVLRSLTPIEREIKSAEDRWFWLRVSPYRTVEDRIDGVVLAFMDITELKATENSLRTSESRFRAIFDQATAGIILADLQGRFLEVNDQFCSLTGYSRQELLQMRMQDITHQEDLPHSIAKFDRLIKSSSPFETEKRYVRKNGVPIWIMASVSPVRDEAGSTQSISAIIVDVSERHEAQEALKRAKDELEWRVEERTAELGTALQEVRAQAREREKAESARTDLMKRLVNTQEEERGRISRELHDNLGQHLTAVMMGLQRLQNQNDAYQGEDRRSTAGDLNNLRQVVDGLMQAAHRQAWELRPAELDDMGLEIALHHYASDWSDRTGITVDFQSTGFEELRPAPEVETTLYRVVQEALTNVARHAEATMVSIILEMNDDATSVSAIIEDNGRGFDSTTTGGRLGLLGMRERLTLVGGSLDIESVPGSGTTLFARVPERSSDARPKPSGSTS